MLLRRGLTILIQPHPIHIPQGIALVPAAVLRIVHAVADVVDAGVACAQNWVELIPRVAAAEAGIELSAERARACGAVAAGGVGVEENDVVAAIYNSVGVDIGQRITRAKGVYERGVVIGINHRIRGRAGCPATNQITQRIPLRLAVGGVADTVGDAAARVRRQLHIGTPALEKILPPGEHPAAHRISPSLIVTLAHHDRVYVTRTARAIDARHVVGDNLLRLRFRGVGPRIP